MARRIALALALILTVAACGDDDTTDTTESGGTTLPGAATTTTTTDGTITTTTTAAEPFLPGLGLETIVQATATSGGGPRPLLAWEPLDGAASYTVVVFDADGSPWWSWQGEETEVHLGGFQTDAEIGGPTAGAGVTWVVYAYDADGLTIGVSPLRALSD
jgi:hypothetical protein